MSPIFYPILALWALWAVLIWWGVRKIFGSGKELPSREQPCPRARTREKECGKHVEESIGLAPDHGARNFRFPVGAVRMVTRNGEDSQPASESKPCSWCFPGVGGPETSHGICERHARELIAEARKEAAV